MASVNSGATSWAARRCIDTLKIGW